MTLGRARGGRPAGIGLAAVVTVAGVAATAVALDRFLAAMPARLRPSSAPVRATVEIAAPIDRVWQTLVDLPGQRRWMPEMKAVTMVTPGPLGTGSLAEATVRIFGIAVRDRVTITRFEPPVAYGIEHQALFGGPGLIELRSEPDSQSTLVQWTERLVPPLLPHLGWIVQRPIIGRLYQRDLFLLREIVEQAERGRSDG
jgi:hypothetical protein